MQKLKNRHSPLSPPPPTPLSQKKKAKLKYLAVENSKLKIN